MPRGLRGVERKGNAARATNLPHRLRVLHCTGHIGRMCEQHQTGVFPQQRLDLTHLQATFPVARNAVERHTTADKLPKRSHNRVVFHRGHQTVVAGPQRAEQKQVQPPCVARREDYMRHRGKGKQLA